MFVATLYDRFAYLPPTNRKSEAEVREFLENYEFSCVGAWEGFHIYISSK